MGKVSILYVSPRRLAITVPTGKHPLVLLRIGKRFGANLVDLPGSLDPLLLKVCAVVPISGRRDSVSALEAKSLLQPQ